MESIAQQGKLQLHRRQQTIYVDTSQQLGPTQMWGNTQQREAAADLAAGPPTVFAEIAELTPRSLREPETPAPSQPFDFAPT